MNFQYTYSPAWLIVAIVLAFIYAFFLYRKDRLLEESAKWIKWGLAGLRFFSVFIIAILLIGIILESLNERKEKPLLFLVNDNSASLMIGKDSSYYKSTFIKEYKELSDRLANDFEVVNYDFSGDLQPDFSGDYSGKSSDLSTVFNTIFDQYTNRNIGGIVVATDGIYNQGANPVYAIARKSFLPVFTVGLGDTTAVKDIRIDRINHNDLAFLGNDFPVEVVVSNTLAKGETVTVSILQNEKIVANEKVTFTANDQQQKVAFTLKASKVGYASFNVQVSAVDDEFSLLNNSGNFYMEIIDGRQKILMTYQAPHPDIAALRYVIEKNKNYEVEVLPIDKVTNLKEYDLVVVHNFTNQSQVLTDYAAQGKGPLLFIVGQNTDLRAASELNLGFSGSSNTSEDVGFTHNSNYKDILLSPSTTQTMLQAPPLRAPFRGLKFSSALEILAYQTVGNIKLDDPLIYFTRKEGGRIGVIMGEGIWRWRLFDQMKNANNEQFSELAGKMVTFLAVKENKDPFKVNISNEYDENEDVIVKAELYNQSFELVNEPEVKMEFKNEEGKDFEAYFAKTGKTYQLDLGKLKPGWYQWTASTNFQGEVYQKQGTFLIKEIKIEYLNAVANHRLLRNIAENSGGAFYFPTELKKLEKDIRERDDIVTVVYTEKEFDDLIDYQWLFAVLVFLLALEWFVRKYEGAY